MRVNAQHRPPGDNCHFINAVRLTNEKRIFPQNVIALIAYYLYWLTLHEYRHLSLSLLHVQFDHFVFIVSLHWIVCSLLTCSFVIDHIEIQYFNRICSDSIYFPPFLPLLILILVLSAAGDFRDTKIHLTKARNKNLFNLYRTIDCGRSTRVFLRADGCTTYCATLLNI